MTDHRESRLLIFASVFLFLYSAILSLSPSVREHSWDVAYRFSHWIGFLVWAVVGLYRISVSFPVGCRSMIRIFFHLASLLSGWGVLTIWRLDPGFGIRQVLWLGVSFAASFGMLYAPRDLNFLRRYKYILLSACAYS